MAYIRRVLQPIRASISVLSSTNSSLRCYTTRNLLLNGNYKHLNTWVKGIEPVSQGGASRFYDKLNIQKYGIHNKLNYFSARKIGVGSILGISVITGVLSLRPQDAYAMNGTDVLEESHISTFWDSMDPEDDRSTFLAFARRFWVPAFLVITVLMSLYSPFTLAVEVILYLLSTKPGSLSVYVFIEKLRRQCIRQDPYSKSSHYAKRVDVEDYVLLRLATVEFGDQEITLIGILGSWWVLNCTPCADVHKNLVA